MANTPRIAKFPTAVLTWTDGSNFNGFALISYVPATGGAGTYTEVDFGQSTARETLPQFAVIPIVDGLYNASLGLYYTGDLIPPGATYICRYYDSTKRLIAGPTAAFTVASDPISSIPSVTLTAPVAGGTAPVPD